MSRTTRVLVISFPSDADGYKSLGVTATIGIEIDRHGSRDSCGRWVGRYTTIACNSLHSDATMDCRGLSHFDKMAFVLREGDTISSMTDVLAICLREYEAVMECVQRAMPVARLHRSEPSIAEQAEHRIAA